MYLQSSSRHANVTSKVNNMSRERFVTKIVNQYIFIIYAL